MSREGGEFVLEQNTGFLVPTIILKFTLGVGVQSHSKHVSKT